MIKWVVLHRDQTEKEGTDALDVPGGMVLRSYGWDDEGIVVASSMVFVPNASVAAMRAVHMVGGQQP